MTCVVHVPYVLEQDGEDVWCASAQLSRLGVKLMVLDRPSREEAEQRRPPRQACDAAARGWALASPARPGSQLSASTAFTSASS